MSEPIDLRLYVSVNDVIIVMVLGIISVPVGFITRRLNAKDLTEKKIDLFFNQQKFPEHF